MPAAGEARRVVVVGAGFGGLNVARTLAGVSRVDVTLVDRNNYHQFLPLLYQVATAGLNAADVAHPVRGIIRGAPNVRFRQATVTAVDWDERIVVLDGGGGPPDRLPFDDLVVAAGATAEYFGVPGAAEHSLPLYTLRDAVALRNHVLGRFEAADADPALIDEGALTFVVVGGGATGVEVAGALVELIDVVLRRDFRSLDLDRAKVVLVEMTDELLPPFAPTSRSHAMATLRSRGVDVRTGEAVTSVEPTKVTLRSGAVVPCHTLVWAAGVRAGGLAATLGVETGRGGRIAVTRELRIPGRPAFAIGDIAATPDGRGGFLPGVAQVAIQGGHHVAAEIRRSLDGRPSRPFRYRDKGSMATIGRRAAVAEIPVPGTEATVHLRGTPGWLAWLGLHLVYLIGFRNRASVVLNWAWNYLTWDRGPRLILDRPDPSDPDTG